MFINKSVEYKLLFSRDGICLGRPIIRVSGALAIQRQGWLIIRVRGSLAIKIK